MPVVSVKGLVCGTGPFPVVIRKPSAEGVPIPADLGLHRLTSPPEDLECKLHRPAQAEEDESRRNLPSRPVLGEQQKPVLSVEVGRRRRLALEAVPFVLNNPGVELNAEPPMEVFAGLLIGSSLSVSRRNMLPPLVRSANHCGKIR